jgi:hypothetical protein
MPRVNCPSCETTLSIPDPIPAAVRCPKCKHVIRMKPPAPARAVTTRQAPATAPPRRPVQEPVEKPRRSADLTAEKPRRAADPDAPRLRRVADEEEDEPRRPRLAGVPDARRARRAVDEDVDQDEDEDVEQDEDEPRRPRKGGRKSQRQSLWQHPAFLIGLGFFLVLLLGGLGAGGYFLFRKGESSSSSSSASSSDKDKEKEKEKDTTSYEIKIRKESKGDKALIVKEDNGTVNSTIKDLGGKFLMEEKKNEKNGSSYKYVEEILEKEGTARATRVRRTYQKAEKTENGMTRTLALQGKTILIEKKGPSYTISVEGGMELPPEDAKSLAKEFNKPESEFDYETFFLPKKAVTVGESWKIDPEPLIKDALSGDNPMSLDPAKTTCTGKLIKVYKKDGKTFGVLEIKMDFAILSMGKPPSVVPLKEGSRFSITMNLDQCIDGTSQNGSSTGSMTMILNAVVPAPDGKQVVRNFDVRGIMSASHEDRAR